MAKPPRKGYRTCQRCGYNKAERFFKPRGRICAGCRRRRVSHASKDVRLQEQYGISLVEWLRILESQGGVCAICGGTRPTYDTDHDHAVEKEMLARGEPASWAARCSIRGILCRRCNRRLLPAAKDSIGILERAIGYLIFSLADTQRVLNG